MRKIKLDDISCAEIHRLKQKFIIGLRYSADPDNQTACCGYIPRGIETDDPHLIKDCFSYDYYDYNNTISSKWSICQKCFPGGVERRD